MEQDFAILNWMKTKKYAQHVEAAIESQLMTSKRALNTYIENVMISKGGNQNVNRY